MQLRYAGRGEEGEKRGGEGGKNLSERTLFKRGGRGGGRDEKSSVIQTSCIFHDRRERINFVYMGTVNRLVDSKKEKKKRSDNASCPSGTPRRGRGKKGKNKPEGQRKASFPSIKKERRASSSFSPRLTQQRRGGENRCAVASFFEPSSEEKGQRISRVCSLSVRIGKKKGKKESGREERNVEEEKEKKLHTLPAARPGEGVKSAKRPGFPFH